MGFFGFAAIIFILVIILVLLASCIRIVPQAQALVVVQVAALVWVVVAGSAT